MAVFLELAKPIPEAILWRRRYVYFPSTALAAIGYVIRSREQTPTRQVKSLAKVR